MKFQLLSEKDRYGLSYSVVACTRCGLVQTNPRMNQAAYSSFYDNEYRALYLGDQTRLDRFFEAEVVKGRRILNSFLTHRGGTSSETFVVEVGCGAGGVLQPFREAGFKTLGCDLGNEYLRYGRERHGLDLVMGSLKDLELSSRPGLVIYSHVLEHVLDPRQELSLVRNAMSPEGFLYIEVPGIRSIRLDYNSDFLRYLQNAHVYHFTLSSLSNLLAKEGFDVIDGDERIRMWAVRGSISYGQGVNDFKPTVEFLHDSERVRKLFRMHPRVLRRGLKILLLSLLDRVGIRDHIRRVIRLFKR